VECRFAEWFGELGRAQVRLVSVRQAFMMLHALASADAPGR
jgi:hypothetical protein